MEALRTIRLASTVFALISGHDPKFCANAKIYYGFRKYMRYLFRSAHNEHKEKKKERI